MIIVIRIFGLVEVPEVVQETLFRLRLRRKYTAVLLQDTEENRKILAKVRNFVAYGPISKETLRELLEKRAHANNKKKLNITALIEQLDSSGADKLNIKPFFRLHPPRGGIDSKIHFPLRKGVLGDNKEKINGKL